MGRFASADTLVPGVGDPRNWDRYAYVRNNPVMYNDPSGHDVGCGGRDDSDCVSYGKLNPELVQDNIYQKYTTLIDSVRTGEITDLLALKYLSDYVGGYTANTVSDYVQYMGSILTGHDTGNSAKNEVIYQLSRRLKFEPDFRYSNYYNSIRGKAELMQSGYANIFRDPGLGGNQAHHLWFYVQVGFEDGLPIAAIGNILHETIFANDRAGMSYEDLALGIEGAKLGDALFWGLETPLSAGNYILGKLSIDWRDNLPISAWSIK